MLLACGDPGGGALNPPPMLNEALCYLLNCPGCGELIIAAASTKLTSDASFSLLLGLFNGELLRMPVSDGKLRASYFEPCRRQSFYYCDIS